VGVASILALDEQGLTRRAGVTFVQKPFDKGALIERVSEAIAMRDRKLSCIVVDPIDGAAIASLLEREGYEVTVLESIEEAKKSLETEVDFWVIELDLEDGDGSELLPVLKTAQGNPARIVLTGREINPQLEEQLTEISELVVQKGTLSRSAFAGRISEILRSHNAPKHTILAVDDNEQNLRLVVAVLARRGLCVLEARDAATAIAIAKEKLPELILMDVMLPDVDGLTATRKLKGDPATAKIPVIAVTAQAMTGDAQRAKEAGCIDYVTKPIDATRLLAAVDAVFARA
jgi:CheY-like chemotaxis protein